MTIDLSKLSSNDINTYVLLTSAYTKLETLAKQQEENHQFATGGELLLRDFLGKSMASLKKEMKFTIKRALRRKQ